MTVLAEGTIVAARYRVLRCIGEGGFGVVYQCQDAWTGAHLALKVLRHERLSGVNAIESFRKEILFGDLVAKHSPHAPRIFDAGYDAVLQRAWLVMTLLQGGSLAEVMQARLDSGRGPFSARETLEILRGVTDALDVAHRLGLVHCDLKPENIFLTMATEPGVGWMPFVLDFGVARRRSDHEWRKPSTVVGSLPWMAPELLDGTAALPASDQWAFAQIAFWMLVGRRFPSTKASQWTASQGARQHGVELPNTFDPWFERATHNDPSERFESIRAAFDALAASLAADRDDHGRREPSRRLASKRSAVTGVLVAILALTVVASVALQVADDPPAQQSGQRSAQSSVDASEVDARQTTNWIPAARLTGIEPGYRAIDTNPELSAALRRWKSFVESRGRGTPEDVYLARAHLRTQGELSPPEIASWWAAWEVQDSWFLAATQYGRFRVRAFDAQPDSARCRFFGSVYEVRLPVREILRGRGQQAVREQPYNDFEAVYTVRFVHTSEGFRVCHENWRLVDFCPGHEQAIDCARWRTAGEL
jgi:serine/threonine protein kinase